MKITVELSKEDVEKAVKSYLQDAGYGTEKSDIQFQVSSGGSSSGPIRPPFSRS